MELRDRFGRGLFACKLKKLLQQGRDSLVEVAVVGSLEEGNSY